MMTAADLEQSLITNIDVDCIAAVGKFVDGARRLGFSAASLDAIRENPWRGAGRTTRPWTPWRDSDD